jgi:hypothetical protein
MWFMTSVAVAVALTALVGLRLKPRPAAMDILLQTQQVVSWIALAPLLEHFKQGCGDEEVLTEAGLVAEGRLTELGRAVMSWRHWLALQPFVLEQLAMPIATRRPWYDVVKASGRGVHFAAAMREFTHFQAPALPGLSFLLECESVCDLGGSDGTLLALLRPRLPRFRRGTVMDADAEALASVSPPLAALVVDYRSDPLPLGGCDCVVAKGILSDLNPSDAEALLGWARRGLSKGARIVLWDHFVGGPGHQELPQAMSVLMRLLLGAQQHALPRLGAMAERAGLRLAASQPSPVGLTAVLLLPV